MGRWRPRRLRACAFSLQLTVSIETEPTTAGPIGPLASYRYDAAGNRLTESNDLAGTVTGYDYDGLYRMKKKNLPQTPHFEEYTWDKVGNRKTFKDATGKVTRFDYDKLNRLTKTTNALEQETTISYLDPEGSKVNKKEERDPTKKLVVSYVYDNLNREQSRIVSLEHQSAPAASYETKTDYFDVGVHRVLVTGPTGVRTERVLDGLDRVSKETVLGTPNGNLETSFKYDALGNVTDVIDPKQNQATVSKFDGLGRLISVTDAKGKASRYVHDKGGLRTSETDRRDVTKQMTYDNLGRPRVTSITPLQSDQPWSSETIYDDAGRKRIERDAKGRDTVFVLDGMDRVKEVRDARFSITGKVLTYEWDGVDKRAEIDRRGNRTEYDYDALHRPRFTRGPIAGEVVEVQYLDALGQRKEIDRRQIATLIQLDPLGRALTVTRSGNTLETNQYDGLGNKTLAQDAEGRKTQFEFDKANRLAKRTDGFESQEAAATTFGYDKNGNLETTIDGRALASGAQYSERRGYDALNRVISVKDGEENETIYDYDAEGHRTLVKEPELQETRYEWDELGKLMSVKQPAAPVQAVTKYFYDRNRNLLRQEDAKQHVTEMQYDELNRLTFRIEEGGLETEHRYDENGNENFRKDPKGQTVTSFHDERNRLKTQAYAFAAGDSNRPWRHTTGVVYTYDQNSNLTDVEESVASGTDPPSVLLTHKGYDALDRLHTESVPLADGGTKDLVYDYDKSGLRTKLNDASGDTVYGYDGRGRLKDVTVSGQLQKTNYKYFPDNLLQEVSAPNGVKTTYTYDLADRVKTIQTTKGTAVVSAFAYGYDKNGNRLTQTETNGGLVEQTNYGYDALNRVKTIVYPTDTAYPTGRMVTYGYDLVGNRERETEKDTNEVVLADKIGSFDNKNRLTVLTDELTPSKTVNFGYDANGNQTSKTTGVGGPTIVVTTNIYDQRDKLVETQQETTLVQEIPETTTAVLGRFQYCYDGRRIKKIGLEGIRQYVYDDDSLLAEYDGAGQTVARYDYGSDRLLSLFRRDEPRRYFSFDGLGSVTNLTDDAGLTVGSFHLDAWGNYRFPAETEASKNRFGFTGYELDKETGLYNAKARYFDPQLGRFLTQDSYLGQIDNPPSLHRYFYGHENPTTYLDADGHSATAVGGALGAAWGLGQAIGAVIDDWRTDSYRPASSYFGLIAQNTVAGLELGFSVDLTLSLGGAAALPGVGAGARAVIGGFAGAGVSGLTFSGRSQTLSEFGTNQAMGAITGALIGAVPELAVAGSAYGVYKGVETAKEGNWASRVIGATEIGLSLAPYASQEGRQLAFGRIGKALEPVLGRVRGALGRSAPKPGDPAFIGPVRGTLPGDPDFIGPIRSPAPGEADFVGPTQPPVAPGSATSGSTYKERFNQTPVNGGWWSGTRGESTFYPYDSSSTFRGQGVPYTGARPAFGSLAIEQVQISGMSTSRTANFRAADKALAQKLGISPREIREWRRESGYTWHEVEDLATMQLIPKRANDLGHLGGVGELKRRP